MSGDVQPRKRREKKKKKEDGPEEVVFQPQHQATTSPIVTDDLTNIHIQKEAATGGGLCAKFVFFILLTVLTTLIGLIITEHRGLTDLDTIDTESRFAQLFEGWIDKPTINHESEEELSIEQSEEHVYEEEDEEDEHEEEDQSVDHDHDDDDDEISEEKATDETASDEENDDDEKEESDLQDDTIENESDEVSNENDDENEDEIEEDEEDEDEEDEEQEYASEDEERDESSIPTKEEVTQEDEEESKEDKYEDESEEIADKTETEESKYTVESEEAADKIESAESADRTESEEAADQTESEEAADQADSDEASTVDDVVKVTTKKLDKEALKKKLDDAKTVIRETITKARQEKRSESENKKTEEVSEHLDQPQETDNYNMVIKFGVGTALLVVAHVVLVQKWRTGEKISVKKPQESTEEAETVTPDLSRRNTIVKPPSLQEIEQDIENVEEEYSEDDEDYDSEENSRSKPTKAKMRYQELQSTYSHTLTPDWEPKEVRENRSKNYEEQEEEEEEGEEEEEVEGDEDYDDEISENEDEELLKRLEAKYGIIRQSDEEPDDDDNNDEEDDEEGELEEDQDEDFDSWKRVKVSKDDVPEDTDSENEKNWSKERSGAQAVYDFTNITNSDDMKIQEELDRARQNLENDAAYALTLFNKILERNPSSPRALYGKAKSLDILAEQKKSNDLLQQAILNYQQVLKVKETPHALFQMAAERCVDRIRFRGLYGQAVPIHKLLIEKFPEEVKFRNQLAVTYLTMNKINEARKILHDTLFKWPNDGFALVHYGFVLKTNNNDLDQAVEFLQRGIATKQPGVIDGRFYFHLGDALTRLGRKEEAMTVYSDGVSNKVFLSKYQRSLYNVERLTGQPWWQKEKTQHIRFFEELERNWKTVRDEGLNILNKKGYFQPEAENLRDVGDWKQFELYARGIKNSKNCKQCPFTCKIVETLPDAIGCRRGQIKFSVMHPGTHVWPHCGPTNCRLRAHLGLKVPSNTYIRVGEEIRSWKEGKLLIFDDSFEHEVWHNGTATRLILIIDIWHPELTRKEKQSLSSI